ncbi:unnamed protein product [Penicillium bialowiezense]
MPNPQFDHLVGHTGRECRKCNRPESLGEPMKLCERCKGARYCNRLTTPDAYASNPEPELSVYAQAVLSANEVAPGLDVNLRTPYTRLHANTWLHGRSEKDCFKLLFDAIRVRVWDDDELAMKSHLFAMQNGPDQESRMLVREFLRDARRKNCLPPWWTDEKEEECIEWGHSEENWKDEDRPVKMAHLLERYGTATIMFQLRAFNEIVLGVVPGKGSWMLLLNYYKDSETAELARNPLQAMEDDR